MTQPLALITGAASGIGAATSRRLADRGYRVIAVELTDELAQEAAAAVDGLPVSCDVGDRNALAALCARIEHEWAPDLDVVIANAGVIRIGEVADQTADDLDTTLDVNLRAAMQLGRAAVNVFLSRNGGHFLATVSMGGIMVIPGSAAYSASKAGLRAFLASLHAEVANTGVRVSGIYPSAVDTPMLRHEARNGGSPLNFVGTVLSAADVADAYERALDTGRLELYAPYSDSVTSRLTMIRPSIVPRLIGPLNRLGERGRAKYLATIAEAP